MIPGRAGTRVNGGDLDRDQCHEKTAHLERCYRVQRRHPKARGEDAPLESLFVPKEPIKTQEVGENKS